MGVPRLPEGLWWDHNAHYHRWLLRQLPERLDRVLDVGCGAGALTRVLAARARHVDGLDSSPAMLDQARRRSPAAPDVSWLQGDLLDPAVALPHHGYDAVVAVASLHHMALRPALERLADLLRPGAVLAVVGLYRPATAGDLAWEAVRLPVNTAVGAALALRGSAGRPDDAMPVLAPTTTLAEVATAVRERLPGATLRRGLFWRYLLTWRRP